MFHITLGLLTLLIIVLAFIVITKVSSYSALRHNYARWNNLYTKLPGLSKSIFAKDFILKSIETAAHHRIISHSQKVNISRVVANAGYGKSFRTWERNTMSDIRASLGNDIITGTNAVSAGVVMIIFLLHREDEDNVAAQKKALKFIKK